MKLSTRLALAAATLAFTTLVQAQAWPTKPVKIIVPYPPGGSVDVDNPRHGRQAARADGTVLLRGHQGRRDRHDRAGRRRAVTGRRLPLPPTTRPTRCCRTSSRSCPSTTTRIFASDQRLRLRTHERGRQGRFKVQGLADLVAAAKAEAEQGHVRDGRCRHDARTSSAKRSASRRAPNFMHIPFRGHGEATMGMLFRTIDFQVASTPGVMGNVKGGEAGRSAVGREQQAGGLPDVPTFAQVGIRDSV